MIALKSGGGADTSTSLSSNSSTTRQVTSKSHGMQRRRRSKGTIAGFASGIGSDPPAASGTPAESNGDPVGPQDHSGSVGASSTSGTGNQPQHSPDSSSTPGKPCHGARLALMCCQNAIRMGARTQLGLCPPGRARRGLKAALKQQRGSRASRARTAQPPTPADTGGYFGVDKFLGADVLGEYATQEENFLFSTNTFDADSDEDASSGDDDELTEVDLLLKEDSPELDDEKKYSQLNEPLFTPLGAENALSNSTGGQLAGPVATGKLPFNRRKLRYFDSISASERTSARAYLCGEIRRSKQREIVTLAAHLKRTQRLERRRIKQERGMPVDDSEISDEEDIEREKGIVPASVSKFDHPMVPAMGAALLLECLSTNPLESIEGMAKCYDGIVAAGVALLEANANDPTSPSSENDHPTGTRSEIMAALTPLLITSLEQPSGDVILSLARLRRLCGTARYQRRFVQRVAPSLIRPPNGAIWCLRHQNDMEPILAAAELIFDSAFEMFSKGWYDRGQLLLADSKRAETLNAAAMQLRNLSTGPSDNLTLGGLGGHGGHGGWRTSRVHKDSTKASNEAMAEWEVIAVDRQIRVSISNIISMDWAKVVVHSRDAELARSYHRARSTNRRPTALPSAASGEMSPKAVPTTPLSPVRPSGSKTPMSPSGPTPLSGNIPPTPTDSGGISFPVNFSNTEPSEQRAKSPVPPSPPTQSQTPPLSPPPPNRTSVDDADARLHNEQAAAPPSLFQPMGHTPPRSPTPKSPQVVATTNESPVPLPTITPQASSPISPSKRTKGSVSQVKQSISGPPGSSPVQTYSENHVGPLSPSSVGTAASSEMPARFMSSASSVTSSLTGTMGTQPAHYRMLTSTSAERKRTVAACRALRAQITRFEEAFIQLHGRPPKGAAERAPLATTYAQYREWKRAIRADASCRIQAMFRGARTRWTLARSNDPRMSRVVLTRAGRQGFTGGSDRLQPAGQEDVLRQLSIPAEIGDPVQDVSDTSGGGTATIGPDGFPTQSFAGQTLPPQWGNQIVRRQSGSSSDGFSGGSPAPRPVSSPSGGSVSSSASNDFGKLTMSELSARKRELKQQLKQYDMNFARRHGRMPVKAEKEPIRHLYERYNALKSQLNNMEPEAPRPAVSSPVLSSHSSKVLTQRTASTVANSDSGGDESPVGMRVGSSQRAPPGSYSGSSGSSGQDLSALRAEKGRLHQMLRSYERDFFRQHQRQVSSYADIRPVAGQYRRYREIKNAIRRHQGGDS